MDRLTHLSLFSGIGGLDLAAEAAGFVTVGQCEFADYPTKILERHWPDVPRWRDIRRLTGESFNEQAGLRTVDVISGGFPCQPFSVAGKQKGREDTRYLWPEMLRVIRELGPRWVVGENVPGILRIAARDVVEDLEREGYDVAVLDFEAAAVGTLHRRERIAFVANRHDSRCNSAGNVCKQSRRAEFGRNGKNLADTGGTGLQGFQQHGAPDKGEREQQPHRPVGQRREVVADGEKSGNGKLSIQPGKPRQAGFDVDRIGSRIRTTGQWAVEPDVGRVADGVPNRVDRIRCLGNAVVPQQFYPIFRAIHEVETGKEMQRRQNQ